MKQLLENCKPYFEKCKLFFEKRPIIYGALRSFFITFGIAVVAIAVLFFVLWITGIYASLESALDLKYNSPYILVPIWGFLALSVLCIMSGMLMFFHKYKRAKSKTAFYKELETVLEKKEKLVRK